MTDTISAPGAGEGPPPASEAQTREYLAQLRSAPAGQLVTELLSGLLNAAQVKLGRRDARLLIDVSGLVLDHTRPHLEPELVRQADQILSQLRLGQVRAEQAAGPGGGPGQPEPNDLAAPPAPRSGLPADRGTPPASSARPEPKAASRLWLPGRDF